jgi:Caspase domain
MKNILTIIALLFAPFLMAQQALDKSNERTIGGLEDEVIHQSLQALNGYIYAVGETRTKSNGGLDGYLLILDPFSQEAPIEKHFGGTEDDVFLSIAALPNGTFVLAGKTQSKGNGKSDGWVIYINDKGRVLSDKVHGSTDDDFFSTVVTSEDGIVYLVGQSGKESDLWIVKEINDKKEGDTKFPRDYIKTVQSGIAVTEGGLVLVGNTKKNDDIWVAKLDKVGANLLFEKLHGSPKTYEIASQIIRTSDGGYVIVGTTTKQVGKRMNAWLLKIDAGGSRQWDENYGDSDIEKGLSVVQTIYDQFILTGSAIVKDARKTQIYTVKTDDRGRILKEFYDGGKFDDEGRSIINLYDGYYGVFAVTDNIGKAKDVLFYTSKIGDIIDNFTPVENTLRFQNWKDAIETNQETSFNVDIYNSSPALINNIQMRLISPAPEIIVPPISYLGFMKKNETKRVVIPISTKAGLLEGEYRLRVQLVVNDKVFSEFNRDIKVKKGKAKFVEFQRNDINGRDSILKIVLINPTTTPTKKLKVKFKLPNELQGINTDDFDDIASIPGGKTREMTLRFKSVTGKSLSEQIPSELFEGAELRDKVIFNVNIGKPTQSITKIEWNQPDEYVDNLQNVETDKPQYEIQLNIKSPKEVQREDFKVYIDKVLLEGKMDVETIKPMGARDKVYSYRYSRIINFTEAKIYQIRVELTTAGSTITSQTVFIKYDPGKPNLHILSIGTTSSDLKYPPKDAKDFANTLSQQAKGVFDKIYTTTLSDSSVTTFQGIRKAFAQLSNKYKSTSSVNRIFSKDYLVVFISSHGKTSDDKSYKLLPSDYNSEDGDLVAVDYEKDVLKQLAEISCHKLVFIDACHSGAAGGKADINSEMLKALTLAATGMTTITSCKSNELSYEDPEWQNGAFTEALIEALTNTQYTNGSESFSSDANNDHYITIKEVYDFIKRRVPHLIDTQKTKRTTQQNPEVTENKLDLNVPIAKY